MFEFKKIKNVRLYIVIILVTTIALGLFIQPYFNVESEIFRYFKETEAQKGTLVAESFFRNKPEQKIVLSKFDLFEPKYSLVYYYSKSSFSDKGIYSVYVVHMKRELGGFKAVKITSSETKNLTFDQAVTLASQGDIWENNPDPENITNYPQPTPEELERIRKNREARESYEKEQAELKKRFDNGTPQEKIAILENEIQKLQERLKEPPVYQDPEEEAKRRQFVFYDTIKEYEELIADIKKENNIP